MMMEKITAQTAQWSGSFGRQYTDRNAGSFAELEQLYQKLYGVTRTELNLRFIGDLPRNIRILEVGSNIGNQLVCLQKMGFSQLYGIELQTYALELAKKDDIVLITGKCSEQAMIIGGKKNP